MEPDPLEAWQGNAGRRVRASAAAMFCYSRGCLAKSASQPAGRARRVTERNQHARSFVMTSVKGPEPPRGP